MTESLIIQLRDGAQPQWMVCNDDGHVVVNAVSGELAQATAMATGRRVAVILPASEVLATDSDAPAKSAAKLAQVIPYALEERVADEIENLHFAIGERDADTGRVPVVVVARARIDARLAELRAAGLQSPGYLLRGHAAAGDAGPDDRAARRRLADDAHRRRAAAGAARAVDRRCLRDGAGRRRPPPVAGLEPAPLGLLLYAGHDEWAGAPELEVDALRDRFTGVKVQLLPSGPLSVLAPAAASGDAVNLLQGALAVASPLQTGLASLARRRGAGRRRCSACISARAYSSSRGCARAKPRSTPASRMPSAPPCPASRTPPTRGGASTQRLDALRSGGGGGALLPGAVGHCQCAQCGAGREDRGHQLS